jgi:hypothetical protein
MACWNDGKVTRSECPNGGPTLFEHRELGLACQDEQEFVPAVVKFPRWSARERRDASSASVERKVADGAVWLGVKAGELDLNHLPDGF